MNLSYPFPAAVLFDWDNTLMDTTPILYKAFCVLREHFSLPEYSMEEYQKQTGLSLRETFPNLFGDQWEAAKQVYLNAYRAHHLDMLTPFDQAREVVAFAYKKTGKVGVVSNKTGAILREEIAYLGWEKYFFAVVGAGDAERDKPAPDPVFKALEGTGIVYEKGCLSAPVWFVGDGNADMECARAAGCLPVRMASENKDGPDVLTVKNCAELLSVLYSCAEML
ncbi:MAG: HAD family hydrolase [Alphaproteobacteria bacterium]|nr:HAD family hydrolase [Alphaproteobacteria bacterium]